MLGFLLVTSKNNVVIADGNVRFLEHIKARIEKEIHEPMEIASTSSGIFTDSTESSSVQKSNGKIEQLSLKEITHLFLPIISLYRNYEARGNFATFFQSYDNAVTFSQLPNKCLLIRIGAQCHRNDVILRRLGDVINTHFGGLLDLIESDLPIILSAKYVVCSQLAKMLVEDVRQLSFLDVRPTVFCRSHLSAVHPLLRSICSQLLPSLGSNRCLLTSNGRILASTNSSADDRPLSKFIAMSDLNSLLNQVSSTPVRNEEISQMWMRSPFSSVPYFVIVIRTRVTEHVTLVCISQGKNPLLSRLLSLLLLQLDCIQGSDDDEVISQITATVKEMVFTLNEMSQNKANDGIQPETAFLRNPPKTAQFLQHTWNRVASELLRCNGGDTPQKPKKRFSIFSIKSAWSTLSVSTSASSLTNHNGKEVKGLPMKVEVLLGYWRRQVCSLLYECCSFACKEAVLHKLPQFRDTIKSILRPKQLQLLQELKIGSKDFEDSLSSFGRPATFRLDVLGYSVCLRNGNLGWNFLPEHLKNDISHISLTSEDLKTETVRGRSGTSYTVVHMPIYKCTAKPRNFKSYFSATDTTSDLCERMNVMAVFPSIINIELAFSQTQKICDIVSKEVTTVSQFLQ